MAIDVRTQSQELIAVVRSDQFVEQLALALPETVSPRRFARIAITAIQQNPDLAKCERDSVFQALLRCAADGLLPDGHEAALVKFGDKAAYLPMISGYRKVAADHGWTLRARVVHENDEFAYSEEPPALTHTPQRPGLEPGPIVAAYAIATHADGRRLQRFMTWAEIEKRKAVARSKNVWEQWPEAMAEKTVGRDIFNELPLGDLDHARIQSMIQAERVFEDAAKDPIAALYRREAVVVPPGAERPAPDVQDNDDTGAGRASSSDGGVATTPAGTEESEAEDGVWEETGAEFTDEQIVAAGATLIPAGVHKDKTLAQVASEDDGAGWLLSQLKKVPADNPARGAIETIVKARLPETWQRYERWLETQADA